MTGIDQISREVLGGLLNSLWIALAIAAVTWTIARCLPRTDAATRHVMWWTVLALVLVLPFAKWDRAGRSGPIADAPRADAAVTEAPAVALPMPPARQIFPLQIPAGDWLRAAIGLWLLFGLLQMLRIAWSFVSLRQLRRASHPAPDDVAERFRYWVATCGIRRPVRLLISERIASPLAMGFLRPTVILPAPLLAQLGEGELDHVLLHELAHVARRDDWTNLVARCLSGLAGLHPVAAWTLRQIARERELACDDWVVARTGEAQPYAASLARLFELCRTQRRMELASGMASHLGGRIEALLDGGREFRARASLSRAGLAAMALLALVSLGAHTPRWVVLAQSTTAPAHESSLPSAPVNPHGSFLAALVAAGYGDLSVEEIISLKDHGIDARFLADLSQCGWEKLSAQDMIALHDHGVPPEMLRALHDAGFQHLEVGEAIHAFEQGVRPGTLKDAAQYGTHLTLAQIVKLKQAGVIQ